MTAINSNRAIRGPVTAVPVVAGKGVRLVADTENNRWVVEADETVLWEGHNQTGDGSTQVALSESVWNFEYVDIYTCPNYNTYSDRMSDNVTRVTVKPQPGSNQLLSYAKTERIEANVYYSEMFYLRFNGTKYILSPGMKWQNGTVTNNVQTFIGALTKIIGVNRVASN